MVQISISSRSHHLRLSDYDATTHRYGRKYIQAKGYNVITNVCAGLPRKKIVLPAAPPINKPVIGLMPVSPDDVRAYRWTFVHQGGIERTVRRAGAQGKVPCTAEIVLPRPGKYDVRVAEELTGGGERISTTSWILRDELVVCLGDSYASGEGNPDVAGDTSIGGSAKCEMTTLSIAAEADIGMDREARWLEPLAHRSLESGHVRAAALVERPAKGQVITLLSFATSGAKTGAGLLDPQHDWQRPAGGQIEEAAAAIAGEREVAAVVLSVGGNDVGFSPGLRKLAKDWRDHGATTMGKNTRLSIGELGPRLDVVNARIRKHLSPGSILVTEYATSFFDGLDGRVTDGCGVFETAFFVEVSKSDA